MKKILILGANPETIPLIETAKSMGIYTIVTDFNPDAPAKKFADMAVNIDGMDVNSIVTFCKQENIDGVLVGVADRLIESYQKVCEFLNLPCYGNQFQCEVLTNKGKFNDLCRQYDITTIPSIKLFKNDSIDIDINYPVFIKPIDKNSGKGMTVAHNKEELREGVMKAFDLTNDSYILLEKYMNCQDVMINYTIINGTPVLSAITDRYTTKEQLTTSKVCLGNVYPSRLLSNYLSNENHKMLKLLKGIGLRNAIFTISAFVENNTFYYYDPGFRLQGEAPNLHIQRSTGFDQKAFLLDIALNNTNDKYNIIQQSESVYSATIWFLLNSGTIKRIIGFDQIEKDPSVFYISKRFNENDVINIEDVGTEAQVFARVYVCTSSREQLKNKIVEIQNIIKVFDTNNNNQLLNGFVYE